MAEDDEVAAGFKADPVGDAEGAADGETVVVVEITGLATADDVEDEEHPATPAPATATAAPAAATRPASLIAPNIVNPHLRGSGAAACTMSRNLAVYTPFRTTSG